MKYKKGDYVQPYSDLTTKLYVENVYKEWTSYPFSPYIVGYYTEKVVCDDKKVYGEDEITYYSKPIQILAEKFKSLEKNKKI